MTMYFVHKTKAASRILATCHLLLFALVAQRASAAAGDELTESRPRPPPPPPPAATGGAALRVGPGQQRAAVNEQPSLRHDQLHRLMSHDDLRRTFQVNSHDQVPEYQILKLTVQLDGSHLISPISDLGELSGHSSGRASEARGPAPPATSKTSSSSEQGAEFAAAETHQHQQRRRRRQSELEATLDERPSASAEVGAQHSERESDLVRHKRAQRDADQDAKGSATATAAAASAGESRAQATLDERVAGGQAPESEHPSSNNKLIVINLSTFGRDFKLRLKRNADFQKRLKDMKMFLAESTADGQLRYTEIKGPPGAQQQAHATYHDEANLAALLIERDNRTGRLQVDGTIGNDFVIKPMPRATLEALRAAHAAKRQAPPPPPPEELGEGSTPLEPELELERAPSSSSSARTSHSSAGGSVETSQSAAAAAAAAASTRRRPETQANNVVPGDELDGSPAAASHLHDDDPHDDDEMFLDEDEALELAAKLSAGKPGAANNRSGAAGQPRAASKAASERKWRKHRKLAATAQTRVPKPQEQAAATAAAAAAAAEAQRARRHSAEGATQRELEHQLMSHHIVFKQRPSSEASSSEHKHSFMLAPGQQTMEEMVRRFPAPAAAAAAAADNPSGERLQQEDGRNSRLFGQRTSASRSDDQSEASLTDLASDPMGGQFYLEPGLATGVARAGQPDWSLWSPSAAAAAAAPGHYGRRRSGGAPPPYALNGTQAHQSYQSLNGTEARARHKRHANGVRSARATAGSQRRPTSASASAPPSAAANRRHKRQAPDVVWPEVLLVVDYDSFLLHGGDSREVKRYFVSFWNGVDLRYKLLVNPHIRISLAGMIVAKDRDATPYLERNRLRAPNADAVDAAGALTDMGKYLYREDRLPTYDLAVVITKLDMCRRRYEGGRCNRGTAGFAYVGGACVVNKRLEKVNSVAIIEDSGGFSGIIVAAHEVGHLLGCVHDGSPPPSYLGGPGATHCPWEDGFIMSDLRHTERGFRWSQCSVEQFKHFLNGETATCLYNYPHESQMLHRLLPGSMLSLDDQCKRDRGTNACFKDARVCAQLFCFDSASGYCVSYRPAAEGSPCGDGHVCRNGKCVGEIENIIPDYTHQTQTVVAAGRGQRPLAATAAAGGNGAVAHPAGRLADNGLSASSTSTATSSPDSGAEIDLAPANAKSAPSSGASPALGPQISSRMDSFPPASDFSPLYTTDQQPQFQRQQHHHHHHQQQQQQQLQQQTSPAARYTSGAASANPRRQTSAAVINMNTSAPAGNRLATGAQFGGRYSAAPSYPTLAAAAAARRRWTK